MREFTVRIKDLNQDYTHVVKQYAESQAAANRVVYNLLKKMLHTDNLEIL